MKYLLLFILLTVNLYAGYMYISDDERIWGLKCSIYSNNGSYSNYSYTIDHCGFEIPVSFYFDGNYEAISEFGDLKFTFSTNVYRLLLQYKYRITNDFRLKWSDEFELKWRKILIAYNDEYSLDYIMNQIKLNNVQVCYLGFYPDRTKRIINFLYELYSSNNYQKSWLKKHELIKCLYFQSVNSPFNRIEISNLLMKISENDQNNYIKKRARFYLDLINRTK